MRLRPSNLEDAEFLFEIKNDPVMRQFAVVTHDEIKWDAHLEWLKGHLHEIAIIEKDNKRAGMFRIDDNKEVSINLHPNFRGQGLGKEVMAFCPKGVWAKIVNGNVPSMKLFLESGFKIIGYEQNYYVLAN